jgi:NADH-quinone oxidoreductase subunit M
MSLIPPWIEIAVALPAFGAAHVARLRDPARARRASIVYTAGALASAFGAWLTFHVFRRPDSSHVTSALDDLLGFELFQLDELNAPLPVLVGLLYLLTIVATLRTKVGRFSFARTLVAQTIAMALMASVRPWAIVSLLTLGVVPPILEIRARGGNPRVFTLHMLVYVVFLSVGQLLAERFGPGQHLIPSLLLVGAIFIRSGMVPAHLWVGDLFEQASFGTSVLFATTMAGAYAAVRLLLPIAPEPLLHGMGLVALFTAVYAAGMALIQTEARRFFSFLFLSHSSLVFCGVDTDSPIGLTGALSLWLSASISLAGFGLTLRALEARHGRLDLRHFRGLYEHTPALALCFLLTGLASVGFPGTLGFLGTEILVDGAIETYPVVGVAVVLAAALNGIAIVQAYFKLFTGTRFVSPVPLAIGQRERFAVLTLLALILGGGFFPQPIIEFRHKAALELLKRRGISESHGEDGAAHSTGPHGEPAKPNH